MFLQLKIAQTLKKIKNIYEEIVGVGTLEKINWS